MPILPFLTAVVSRVRQPRISGATHIQAGCRPTSRHTCFSWSQCLELVLLREATVALRCCSRFHQPNQPLECNRPCLTRVSGHSTIAGQYERASGLSIPWRPDGKVAKRDSRSSRAEGRWARSRGINRSIGSDRPAVERRIPRLRPSGLRPLGTPLGMTELDFGWPCNLL